MPAKNGFNDSNAPVRAARALAALVIAATLAACTSLPDARRLADASAQLSSAVAASGAGAAAELDAAGQADRAAALRAAWQVPERSSVALARYAESLAAIIAAGLDGAESVRRVAAAGTELAAGVGLALPGSAAAATGLDLAAQVYQQIAAVRAARALDEALERMQPAVERITGLMSSQLDDAQAILVSANRISEVKLRAQYSDETGYLIALRRERVALYGQSPLTPANAERLLQIDRVERTVLSRLAPMNAEIRTGNARLQATLHLIGATRQALADWSLAHRQMLDAVRSGTAVDPQALLQSVLELRALVQKARAR